VVCVQGQRLCASHLLLLAFFFREDDFLAGKSGTGPLKRDPKTRTDK
jgi:hypothetical protein